MTTYARKVDGQTVEIIEPVFIDIDNEDGSRTRTEVPIEERFAPDFVSTLEVVADGTVLAPPPPNNMPAPLPDVPVTREAGIAAMQQRLDTGAMSWGYDSIVSAATYVASSIEQFRNESKALLDWRDASWTWAMAFIADVESGATPLPDNLSDLLALVPPMPTRPT